MHLALPLWIWHGDLHRIWGHGFVFVSDHGRRRRRRGMDREGQGTQQVAGYVAKYVTKSYEGGDGRQGYGVAEGFQPPVVPIWGVTAAEVRDLVEALTAADVLVLNLLDLDGYEGPPAFWARWDP